MNSALISLTTRGGSEFAGGLGTGASDDHVMLDPQTLPVAEQSVTLGRQKDADVPYRL